MLGFLNSLFTNEEAYEEMRKEQLANMDLAKTMLSPMALINESREIYDNMGFEGMMAGEQMAVDSEARGVVANLKQLLGSDSGSALGAIYGSAMRGAGRMQGNNLRRAAMMDVFDRVLQKQGVLAQGYAGLPTIQRDTKSGFSHLLDFGGNLATAFGGNPWKQEKKDGQQPRTALWDSSMDMA